MLGTIQASTSGHALRAFSFRVLVRVQQPARAGVGKSLFVIMLTALLGGNTLNAARVVPLCSITGPKHVLWFMLSRPGWGTLDACCRGERNDGETKELDHGG